MDNKLYFQIQSYINDILGGLIAGFALRGLFLHPEQWTFVLVVFIGCTMIFGRNLGKYIKIPGTGGGTEDSVLGEPPEVSVKQ
jgi:hypothetical protein